MLKRVLFFAILLKTGGLLAQMCSPLAYESFGYPNNTPIHTQGDGSGWQAPWEVQNANTAVPGWNATTATTLAYQDLQENGNALTGGSAYLTLGRLLNTNATGTFAPYLNAANQIGAVDSTIWFSIMLRKTNNNDERVFATLHQSNIVWYQSNPSPALRVGYFGTSSNQGGQRFWSLQIGTESAAPILTTVPVVAGQTALLVVSVHFNANSANVQYWVNPTTIGSVTPPAANVTTNSTTGLQFRSLALYLGSNAGQGQADEIRFANSYQCATPNASTPVNNPPTANFTMSATSGNAPLTVNFNGTGSVDDQGIVAYSWHFADGTPNNTAGAIISHTFQVPGVMNVALTVTDPFGSQHTRYHTLVVYDSAGYLSCNISMRLNRIATCGQNNGRFQLVNDLNMGQVFEVKNAAGTIIAPTTTSGLTRTYDNLMPGAYTVHAMGIYGCSDDYTIRIPVDSFTCAGWQPEPCRMPVGTNLSGIAYWVPERPFTNLFKSGDEFFSFYNASPWPWNSGVMSQIPVDVNGYPLQLPVTINGQQQRVRAVVSSGGNTLPLGQYVLLYEGQGAMALQGGLQQVSASPGRIVFNVMQTGNCWININESALGNHIRNIRLLRIADEFSNQTFYSGFRNRLSEFTTLRFMDWGATNQNNTIHWADRTSPTFHTQSLAGGVAYEYMIQLCNELQKNAWVCVPHAADDNYIRELAKLFRDNLNPNLKIYLEYSNEVWNWQFAQAHWVADRRPDYQAYPRAYTDRSLKVFRIWYEEFGANAPLRLKRTLATQNLWSYIGEQIMAQSHGEFDCFSPTFYFGYDPTPCGINANSTAQNIIDCARAQFRANANAYRQEYWNAKLYGKEIVGYEGGQHITHNPVTVPWQQAIYDAQISPDMGNMYEELFDSLRRWDNRLAMHFTFCGQRVNVYGSFGALEDIDQDTVAMPAPKWNAVLNNACIPCLDMDNDGMCNTVDPDDDNDGVADASDCAPFDAEAYPGATEVCDGKDNDCDGKIDEPIVLSAIKTNVSCLGGSNGAIDLTANCGLSPYSYAWNNGATTQDLVNVPAGSYRCTVTDNQGLTKVYISTITQPTTAVSVSATSTPTTCPGGLGGTATAAATGGTGTKTYLWNTGSTAAKITNVASATYTVTATDTKGCTSTKSILVGQPPMLVVTVVAQTQLSNGLWKVTLSGSGGTPFATGSAYRFRKCPASGACSSYATATVYSNLTAGNYTFWVRDSKLCTASINVVVGGTAAAVVVQERSSTEAVDLQVSPNPTDGMVFLHSATPVASVAVRDALGRVVLEKSGNMDTIDLGAMANGLYLLEISLVGQTGKNVIKVVKQTKE